MFSCAAEGSVSLLALVPVRAVAEPDLDQCEDDLVVVHATACKAHSMRVRRWLQERVPTGEQVDAYGTEYLMERWSVLEQEMGDVPVLRMAHAG